MRITTALSVGLLVLATLMVAGCARILTASYSIVVDEVFYEVRRYELQSYNSLDPIDEEWVVVIGDREYPCRADRNSRETDPDLCEETVRSVLASRRGVTQDPLSGDDDSSTGVGSGGGDTGPYTPPDTVEPGPPPPGPIEPTG